MRTLLRSKVTLLFMLLGLLLAIPAIALADTIQNDVTSTAGQKIVSVQAGQTSSLVGYLIKGQNNDPSVSPDTNAGNCNPVQTGTPADVTLTGVPTGVTVQDTNGNTLPTPSTTYHLRFTTCDTVQSVKFNVGSAVAAGDYTIGVKDLSTATPDPGNNDGYNESPAAFTLRVTTPSDTTAPTVTASAVKGDAPDFTGATTYTADTWTNKDVKVTFTCADNAGGSGLTAASGNQVKTFNTNTSASGTTASFDGTCVDNAGNTAAASNFGPIKIDKTNPTISSAADRLNGDNTVAGTYDAGTWTNKSVRVSFSCNDGLSGVNTTSSNIAGDTLTTEGENQSVSSTGSCVDQAGNTASGASFSDIDIDKTAPTNIQFSGTSLTNNQTYEFGSVPAGPTGCSANGDISGLKSPCSTDAATTYKTTVGTHTITATAEDNAGNIGHATLVYTVDPWDATGFYSPVGTTNSEFLPAPGTLPTVNDSGVWNTVKGGSTVPLKFNVFAGSTEKTSTSDIQALQATKLAKCAADGAATADVVDFTTTETTSLRYSGTPGVDGQFIQNWKTPKVTAETCYRTAVTLKDGSSIYAFFKLLK